MPAPFGWNPLEFWGTLLPLGAVVLLIVIGVPIGVRRWDRADRAERERVAGVLRDLAAELGGEFIGPRDVTGVDDEGETYGPRPDYGTALVTSSGLAVEAGVQVMGGPNGKSLKVWVALPPGRTWEVAWLHARHFHWRGGDPRDPRTFRRCYRSADPERLGQEARAALVDLRRHARDVRLDGAGLTVWALPPRDRADALVTGVTAPAALVPHVRRTAAAARLLLGA